MPFTGQENHTISLQDAAVLTKRYRDANINAAKGGFFGEDAIKDILNQPGCVGIRYYFALDVANVLKVVLVGTDANENDLVNGEIAEFSVMCPTICGINNPLNSN